MDIGDIILLVFDVLLFLCLCFAIFICLWSAKLVRKYGYKKTFFCLGLSEATMIVIGVLQLWVVLYPPFVYYTWNKAVMSEFWNFVLGIIRYGYLGAVFVLMPVLIVSIGLLGIISHRKVRR